MAHFRLHISTKPRSGAAFERSMGSSVTSLLLLLLLREHTPRAHNEQRGYARCPVYQANCVWFHPAPPSALTATNVAENAVVDCKDSVVKPIRTATTQCSASVTSRDSRPVRLPSANGFQNRGKQGVHHEAGRISFD